MTDGHSADESSDVTGGENITVHSGLSCLSFTSTHLDEKLRTELTDSQFYDTRDLMDDNTQRNTTSVAQISIDTSSLELFSSSTAARHRSSNASQLTLKPNEQLKKKVSTPVLPIQAHCDEPDNIEQNFKKSNKVDPTLSNQIPRLTLSSYPTRSKRNSGIFSAVGIVSDMSSVASTLLTSSVVSTSLSRGLTGSITLYPLNQTANTPYRRPPGRRLSSLYNSLTPSYQAKLEQFRRIFLGTPVDTDRLLVDYSCALSKNNNGLLLQGRMYITETWICFYSKILYEQKIYLPVKDIVSITKEKTARVIPNAIQIVYSESHERFFFTSFASRERTFAILRKIWENCRNHQSFLQSSQTMTTEEIMQQIREIYGDYSPAMLEDEDTDGDPEIVPDNYLNKSGDLSESSSSQLTGAGYSKMGALEDPSQFDHTFPLGVLDEDNKLVLTEPEPTEGGDTQFSDLKHSNNVAERTIEFKKATLNKCHSEIAFPDHKSAITENEATSNELPKFAKADLIKGRKRKSRQRRTGSSTEFSSIRRTNVNLTDTVTSAMTVTDKKSSTELGLQTPAVCSPTHEHSGRLYADTEVPLNVDALFTCIFTDSEFFARLSVLRGTFNMVQSAWPTIDWSSSDLRTDRDIIRTVDRTIAYTLTLKQKLGPRTCAAIEHQTLLINESKPGERYVIDAKVTNQAVPLCNCFCVISRYCLLRIDQLTSRLCVRSQVVYEKPVFFGAKSIIENTCRSGLTDFFNTLIAQLTEHVSNLSKDERLTGGWLSRKSEQATSTSRESQQDSENPCEHNNSPKRCDFLNANNKSSTPMIGLNDFSGDPKKVTRLFSSNTDSNSNRLKSCSQSKLNLLGSNDMTYLFLRPDRAWLLLVVVSLLLCLCLSMVYNRLLALERLAEQISSTSVNEANTGTTICRGFEDTIKSDSNSLPITKFNGPSIDDFAEKVIPIYPLPASKIQRMKDLTQSLTRTFEQMQQIMKRIQNGIKLLEFQVPSDLNMVQSSISENDGKISTVHSAMNYQKTAHIPPD